MSPAVTVLMPRLSLARRRPSVGETSVGEHLPRPCSPPRDNREAEFVAEFDNPQTVKMPKHDQSSDCIGSETSRLQTLEAP